MSANAQMPYFIKPSIQMDVTAKKLAYQEALIAIDAVLKGETNPILKMATINCLLKTYLPYYYWVGFYILKNDRLEVGPYQGTLGCLHIDFSKGVCGKAAREETTQIVSDCHALVQGSEHIACDPNTQSEIVVPVFGSNGQLLAVFDVDSTLKNSFDKMDQTFLEELMDKHFRS